MIQKIVTKLRIGIQLSCLGIFSLCSQNGYSQNITETLKQEVIQNIRIAEYEKACSILECNSQVLGNDTTGLFEALVNLYFFEKKWDSIIKLYSLRKLGVNEDTSILALARFYSKYNDERTILNSALSIPYKPNRAGTPMIEVRVNGNKYHFWVDTGAGMTVLSSDIAQTCNIRQDPSINTEAKAATGNRVSIIPGLIDSLSIGSLNIYNHHCILVDRKDLEFRCLGIRLLKIDGIIGWNFLQEFDVTINDKTNTLSLSLATSIKKETGVNFFWSGKPLIACFDPSGLPYLFFIDTGASKSGLYGPFLERADITKAIKKEVHVVSAGGLRKFNSYEFPRVDIIAGGQSLVLEKVSVLPASTTELFEIDGVFGMKELKNCILHFNIKQGFFTISK